MSRREELDKMPCGFDSSGDRQLDFTEVKSRPSDVLPVDKLSEDQKRMLTLNCWKHGSCDDIFLGDQLVTQSKAIEEIKKDSELGKKLVQLTMASLAHIYKTFSPHNEKNYPLVKMITKPRAKPKPAVRPEDDCVSSESVKVYNHLSVTVYIYKLNGNQATYSGINIPAKSILVRQATVTPDFTGQWWEAHASMEQSSSIVGFYVCYPERATWDIISFPTHRFLPSAWNSTQSLNIHIINNLDRHVCVWQVMPNGKLNFVGIVMPNFHNDCDLCYIGTSLVATHINNNVISTFFVDSSECTTWSLDIDTPPSGEEIYATGDNNYIFYQVKPQDDMVTLQEPKYFRRKLKISSKVTYLYASVFECYKTCFAAAENVTVTIDSYSEDPRGGTKNYKVDTNTGKLYIQMTANNKSLQKLFVKDPAAGVWEITIQVRTSTPVCFQFQTVPTADLHDTMKATLSSSDILGSNWKDIAYASFANIVCTQTFNTEELKDIIGQLPKAVSCANIYSAEVQFLLGLVQDKVTNDVQNDPAGTQKATNTVRNIGAPTPSDMYSILLVDANGADDVTKAIYESRKQFIYSQSWVETAYGVLYENLVGKNEATKVNFMSKLNNLNLKLVSVAGHGNNNCIYGYVISDVGPSTPILLTNEVTEELATGKIFHFLACNTANNLGPTLIKKKATAFIGYKECYVSLPNRIWMTKPDCIIDKELINESTVYQAVQNAIAMYDRFKNNLLLGIEARVAIEQNQSGLIILGNDNAKLLQAHNINDEQLQSTSQGEQQSVSQDEQLQSMSKDEWQQIMQDEQQKSTNQDEQHLGKHNQAANQYES